MVKIRFIMVYPTVNFVGVSTIWWCRNCGMGFRFTIHFLHRPGFVNGIPRHGAHSYPNKGENEARNPSIFEGRRPWQRDKRPKNRAQQIKTLSRSRTWARAKPSIDRRVHILLDGLNLASLNPWWESVHQPTVRTCHLEQGTRRSLETFRNP